MSSTPSFGLPDQPDATSAVTEWPSPREPDFSVSTPEASASDAPAEAPAEDATSDHDALHAIPDEDPDKISPRELLTPSHRSDGAETDPNNREWWSLWKNASMQAEYERADWIQSRNVTALLTVRDLLLILITCVTIIAVLILAHTLTLWRRYPVQYEWYTSKKLRRNFAGARGVASMPAFSTPSFMELALNNTYPALVPYLAPLGYREYPPAMVEFILFLISIAGGNLDQRSMGGIARTDIKKYLPDPTGPPNNIPFPSPDQAGGEQSPWKQIYEYMWKAWSTMSNYPVGHENPFFWMFPTKLSFCTSVIVNEWIDTQFDYERTNVPLLNVMQMGFSEWARDRAIAGLNVSQMFSELFATIELQVGVSVDCKPLIDAVNIQMSGGMVVGGIGGLMMGVMMFSAIGGPPGVIVGAIVGAIVAFFSIFGAGESAKKQREQAITRCKQQYNTLLSYAAYNACVVYSPLSGPDAQRYCDSEMGVWASWAKRILPPPKNT
jgi:hypothetical protein